MGHHPSDLQVMRRSPGEMLFTAEEVAASLDPDAWDVVAADAPGRRSSAVDPDGVRIAGGKRPQPLFDPVLRSVRVGAATAYLEARPARIDTRGR